MYVHTQRGTRTMAALGAGCVLTVLLLFVPSVHAVPQARVALWVTFVVLLLSILMFSSLTITVRDGVLAWHFGPGVFGKSVPLRDVTAAEPTTTSLLAGTGIHLTLRGWLYNVSGRRAVLITMRDGGRFLLGSEEPERLAAAIDAARGRASD